jgi:hypothetical protein
VTHDVHRTGGLSSDVIFFTTINAALVNLVLISESILEDGKDHLSQRSLSEVAAAPPAFHDG